VSSEPRHVHEGGCITCGDVAVRMRVLELNGVLGLAVCVDAEGRSETVDVGIVGAVAPGDVVLVHAGTALHKEPATTDAERA
jgi:hydrogenase maturation factor